jgi:hypothetical protein
MDANTLHHLARALDMLAADDLAALLDRGRVLDLAAEVPLLVTRATQKADGNRDRQAGLR